MVTITQNHADEPTQNIITLATTEDAEAFLDRLSGNYWGLPGFTATRNPGTLTIAATIIGGDTAYTTYAITEES